MAIDWKAIRCKLTGGHLYDPGELKSICPMDSNKTFFIHRCVKCGRWDVAAIDNRYLFRGVKNDGN